MDSSPDSSGSVVSGGEVGWLVWYGSDRRSVVAGGVSVGPRWAGLAGCGQRKRGWVSGLVVAGVRQAATGLGARRGGGRR